MRYRRRMRWLLVLFVIASDIRTADACATAPPRGEEVRIAEEEALIVWDPATHTEQFIRRAGFRSTARQFGFLVPTPTTPQLSEVPDSIFWTLADYIRPEVKYERPKKYVPGSLLFNACIGSMMKGAKDDARAQAPVRVLQTANVGGFDATTVEADDPKALTDWLGQHGFEATPQLTAWLERYVSDHWKITTFVVGSKDAQPNNQYDLATRAVKMTFPADKPFYPYREPKIEMTVESTAKLAPVNDRLLRVFFVSNERYAATMNGEPWSAKVLSAAKLAVPPSGDLATLLGAQQYMTVFVDESSPRRGIEEVYFAPSTDKADVHQPAQVVIYPDEVTIPIDIILIGGLVIFFVVRRVRKARTTS